MVASEKMNYIEKLGKKQSMKAMNFVWRIKADKKLEVIKYMEKVGQKPLMKSTNIVS